MLEEMLRKNELYSAGKLNISGEDLKSSREATKEGQSPKAVVVACSDSRVVPEYIFGANIGEIFVIRIAGNRPDEAGMGSIEYAIDHLGVDTVIVLGHENCGAVGGALKGEVGETPLGKLLKKISEDISGSENIDEAVAKNVFAARKEIMESLSHLKSVKEGKVKFIPATYRFSDGKVILLE